MLSPENVLWVQNFTIADGVLRRDLTGFCIVLSVLIHDCCRFTLKFYNNFYMKTENCSMIGHAIWSTL